jgi:8-oxo-dGTP diphosphatase
MLKKIKESTVTLLHIDYTRFLLQLRDLKDWIPYPGHWGAFGGEIEIHENPETAGCRELLEELGYVPEAIHYFRDYFLDSNVHLHVFYAEITVPISEMKLMEGLDMGLFSLKEIYTLELYSSKMDKKFPVPSLLADFFRDFTLYISTVEVDQNNFKDRKKIL